MTEPTNATPPEETPESATPAVPAPSAEIPEDADSRPKIQVGRTGSAGGGATAPGTRPTFSAERKRERRERKPQERRPQEEPMKVNAVVPAPTRRDRISEELEAEINAALGGMSLQEIVEGPSAANVGQSLDPDARIRAQVIRVHGDNVFFALTGRNEGVASVRQFANPPEAGAFLDVVIKRFNNDDGLYEVAVPGASMDVSDWSDITDGLVVEARVTGSNAGGLECMVNNIRGFIPASQISLFRVENLGDFVNQKLQCVVTEANPERRNLVLSHRAILEREKESARQQLLEQLEVGQVREGTVRSIRDFGAFVDIGGVDGLIHISQLSWDRVKHPSEVLQEGQKVKVKVEKIDPQTGKIGLSYRDLLDHPWHNIQERMPAGSIVKGVVSRLAKFGAFVKLGPGVEGLVHITEISHQRIRNLASFLQEGKEVEVKILSIDPEEQRIALSLKAMTAPPEAEPEVEVPDEPARQPAVARRNEPLKGGTDRPSGGEQFGLRW